VMVAHHADSVGDVGFTFIDGYLETGLTNSNSQYIRGWDATGQSGGIGAGFGRCLFWNIQEDYNFNPSYDNPYPQTATKNTNTPGSNSSSYP
jgi:hypothetical protein